LCIQVNSWTFVKLIIRKEEKMARPIKEPPILFGEDARKFEERMKQVRKETPEQREKRLKRYKAVINVFKE
jgi:hypothetical protein